MGDSSGPAHSPLRPGRGGPCKPTRPAAPSAAWPRGGEAKSHADTGAGSAVRSAACAARDSAAEAGPSRGTLCKRPRDGRGRRGQGPGAGEQAEHGGRSGQRKRLCDTVAAPADHASVPAHRTGNAKGDP